MNAAPMKQRAYVVAALVCGALSSGLVWKRTHRVDPKVDQVAQGAGFSSQADADRSMRYFERAKAFGRLDEKEYVNLAQLLAHGNQGEKMAALVALHYVKGDGQHRRALALAGNSTIPKDLLSQWHLVFTWWVKYQADPGAMRLLLASKNPQIVEIARGLKHEG